MDPAEAQRKYDEEWEPLNAEFQATKLSGDQRTIKALRQRLSALSVKYIDRKNKDEHLENPYPECSKLAAIAPISQELGRFLDEGNYALCTYSEEGDRGWIPTNKNIETLLGEHFDIDMKLVEEERQQLLDSL